MSNNRLNSRFLFVYGTLRFSHNGNMSNWLKSTGTVRLSAEATTRGTVENLGAFPGAKFLTGGHFSEDANTPKITGELLAFPDGNIDHIMERLDQYEGVSSGLYSRVIVDVHIPGHDFTIEALAYEYAR